MLSRKLWILRFVSFWSLTWKSPNDSRASIVLNLEVKRHDVQHAVWVISGCILVCSNISFIWFSFIWNKKMRLQQLVCTSHITYQFSESVKTAGEKHVSTWKGITSRTFSINLYFTCECTLSDVNFFLYWKLRNARIQALIIWLIVKLLLYDNSETNNNLHWQLFSKQSYKVEPRFTHFRAAII